MSRLLARKVATETVSVEVFSGLDGQGVPSYGAATAIEARAVETDELVIDGQGSEVRTTLTLYVDSGQPVLPSHRDRVTWDGQAYIGIDRAAPRDFKGGVDHIRLRCREE